MSDAAFNSLTGDQSLDPAAVFFAPGSEVRWPIIQLLADGQRRTATDVATSLHRDFDGVSKHLKLMAEAGVVLSQLGNDRRHVFFPSRLRTG